jgi:hypothetical protein
MRKIVANLFISLDGVVERPDQWHFTYFNDEMGEVVGSGMAASDTMCCSGARPTRSLPPSGQRRPSRRPTT